MLLALPSCTQLVNARLDKVMRADNALNHHVALSNPDPDAPVGLVRDFGIGYRGAGCVAHEQTKL